MSKRFSRFVSIVLTLCVFLSLLPIRELRADLNTHGEYSVPPFEVTYTQNASWDTTTQGAFNVENVSEEAVSSWSFEIEYLYPVTVSNIYGASLVNYFGVPTNTITVVNEVSNGNIAAGSSTSFGLMLVGEAEAPIAPVSVRLISDNTDTPVIEPTDSVFPYAIFSGSNTSDLTFNGWRSEVVGDVYTGSNYVYNGSELTLNGTVRAVGSITSPGWNINITNQVENAAVENMPDWGNSILARGNELPAIDPIRFTSEDPILTDGYCYIDGDVTISGTTFEGDAIIVASGDITYNINEISGAGRVLLYSENGNITINGTAISVNGILYAPNGRVSISAYNTTLNGRIVANEVFFSGSILDCYANPSDLDMLYPDAEVTITPSPTDEVTITPTDVTEITDVPEVSVTPSVEPTITPPNDAEIMIEVDTSPFIASEYDGLYYIFTPIESVSGTLTNSASVTSFTYSISSIYADDVASGELTIADNWSTENIGFFLGPTRLILTAITSEGEEYSREYVFFSYTYLNADRVGVDITSDDDVDGLPNYLENEIGTNPNSSDSDNDGLSDFVELYVFLTNPINPDTDGNGINDGDEDVDCDGLSNSRELELGTNPGSPDSDEDGLTDYQEVSVYFTDPTMYDSDSDGLSDGDEIIIGKNPLDASDADVVITQTVSVVIDNAEDSAITSVDVTMDYAGNLRDVIQIIDLYNIDTYSTDVYGRVGSPLGLYTCIDFDSAIVTIHYNNSELSGVEEENLGVLWYDDDSGLYEVQEQAIISSSDDTITIELNHFSTYVLVDLEKWNNPILPDYSDYLYVAHGEETGYWALAYVPSLEEVESSAWFWWHLTNDNMVKVATLSSEAVHKGWVVYDFFYEWLVMDGTDNNGDGISDFIEQMGILGTNHHLYEYDEVRSRLGIQYVSSDGPMYYLYYSINNEGNHTDRDHDGLYSGEARYNQAGDMIIPADPNDNFPNAPIDLLNTHCQQVYDGHNVATYLTETQVGYPHRFPYELDLGDSFIADAADLWFDLLTFNFNNPTNWDTVNYYELLSYIGCYTLWFYDDDLGQAAHSDDNQWQRHMGYCDLYDYAFRIGTQNNIDIIKLPSFIYNGNRYIFWGWRGTYLNLGTGGELGFYYNPVFSDEEPAWWPVAPYEIDMELHIYSNENVLYDSVLNWAPDDNQWWITGFNYHEDEWNPDVNNIYAIMKIDFRDVTRSDVSIDGRGLYEAFRMSMNGMTLSEPATIIFDNDTQTVYIIWGRNIESRIYATINEE